MLPSDRQRHSVAARDTGYAWVVLAGCVVLNSLVTGAYSSYGVFFVEYVTYFRVTKARAAVISALGQGISGLSGIVLGFLVRKTGKGKLVALGSLLVSTGHLVAGRVNNIHMLYLFHGFLPGIGLGAFIMGCTLSLMQYFDRRRGLAMGLATAGSSLGVFIFPALNEFLIRQYTWRGALLIFAAIEAHGIAIGLLLRPPPERTETISQKSLTNSSGKQAVLEVPKITLIESGKAKRKGFVDITKSSIVRTENRSSLKSLSVFRDIKILVFYCVCFLGLSGHFMPYSFLPARAVSLGMNSETAAFLISLIGISSGVSRPLCGWVSDCVRQQRAIVMACCLVLGGGLTFCSAFLTAFPAIYVYAALYGCLSAGYMTLQPVILADMTSTQDLPLANGAMMFIVGCASLSMIPLGGVLVDVTSSYATPFLVFGMVQAAGGLLAFLLYSLQQWQRRHLKDHVKTDAEGAKA